MVYRFGKFELDEAAHVLRESGVERSIEPKVMAFLILLLRARGRAMTRACLYRAIWGDVRVSENSLNRVAKEARAVLADDGGAQRMIRTIRRVGYRFEAEIDVVEVENVGVGDLNRDSLRRVARAQDRMMSVVEGSSTELRMVVEDFARCCTEALDWAHAKRADAIHERYSVATTSGFEWLGR